MGLNTLHAGSPLPAVRSARAWLSVLAMLCVVPWAAAQPRPAGVDSAPAAGEPPMRGVVEWLQRMHQASRQRSYVGTFVVSAAGGNLSSARIWHVGEGDLQVERIESLTGPPRSTFRRNDRIVTFLPEARLVRSERRENADLFPSLQGAPDAALANWYDARVVGKGRVAGFEADVVQLVPRDPLRFGYRIWSERQSGLVVKLQTLDGEGQVVEQSAFSELSMDPPIRAKALAQMMDNTAGYRVEKSELERTTAQAEGWMLQEPVPGFRPLNCFRRALGPPVAAARMVQWTFTDGLATVSLFLEPYDDQRPQQEAVMALGATYTLTRRIADAGGQWWLTAVGEVPPRTLEAFGRALGRTR